MGAALLLLLAIAALLIAIFAQKLTNSGASRPLESNAFAGAIAIDPPQPMPDFSLLDQHSQVMKLSDLRGRFALITFGYTHCPDVCPLTLNEFRRIHQALGDQRDQVAFVFVSVDGARDKPAVIHDYFQLRGYDGIIGLTGDEAALRRLGVDYGLSFEREGNPARGPYLVNHTAGSFLLDRQGRWIMRYQFGVLPSVIAADLSAWLDA